MQDARAAEVKRCEFEKQQAEVRHKKAEDAATAKIVDLEIQQKVKIAVLQTKQQELQDICLQKDTALEASKNVAENLKSNEEMLAVQSTELNALLQEHEDIQMRLTGITPLLNELQNEVEAVKTRASNESAESAKRVAALIAQNEQQTIIIKETEVRLHVAEQSLLPGEEFQSIPGELLQVQQLLRAAEQRADAADEKQAQNLAR